MNRTPTQLDNLHNHKIDEENFELWLEPEDYSAVYEDEEPGVEYLMANKFIKNIRNMGIKAKEAKKPILIHMKTCGGDWHEGMAIYHAIKACPVPTIILSYTHARSMSSIILQAADKRVLMSDSIFMIHWGTDAIAGESKTVDSIWTFYKDTYNTNDRMISVYADRMCKANSDLKKPALKRKLIKAIEAKGDKFYTEEQAVEENFADEVFDYNWEKLKKNVKKIK